MTVRASVQGATFNMRGQLYRGHANTSAFSRSPVVSALSSESDDPGSSPGRGKVLCTWDVREKKMRAPLLGLAKSIYYYYYIDEEPNEIKYWKLRNRKTNSKEISCVP